MTFGEFVPMLGVGLILHKTTKQGSIYEMDFWPGQGHKIVKVHLWFEATLSLPWSFRSPKEAIESHWVPLSPLQQVSWGLVPILGVQA